MLPITVPIIMLPSTSASRIACNQIGCPRRSNTHIYIQCQVHDVVILYSGNELLMKLTLNIQIEQYAICRYCQYKRFHTEAD